MKLVQRTIEVNLVVGFPMKAETDEPTLADFAALRNEDLPFTEDAK